MCAAALGVRREDWSPQAVALMVNAMATGGPPEPPRCAGARALLLHLVGLALALPSGAWLPQEVAMVANGLSREGVECGALLARLSEVVQAFPPAELDPLNVANIANAYARFRARDPALMAHLAEAALAAPCEAFSAQAVSNILNAFGRVGARNATLFARLAHVALQAPRAHTFLLLLPGSAAGALPTATDNRHNRLQPPQIPPAEFAPQNIGNLMNAMARSEVADAALARHLAAAWAAQPPAAADAQAICNVLHALAALHLRALPEWEVALLAALTRLPPAELAPQGLANAAWAVAVLRVRDPHVVAWVRPPPAARRPPPAARRASQEAERRGS